MFFYSRSNINPGHQELYHGHTACGEIYYLSAIIIVLTYPVINISEISKCPTFYIYTLLVKFLQNVFCSTLGWNWHSVPFIILFIHTNSPINFYSSLCHLFCSSAPVLLQASRVFSAHAICARIIFHLAPPHGDEKMSATKKRCCHCKCTFASQSKLKRHFKSRCHRLRILSLELLNEVLTSYIRTCFLSKTLKGSRIEASKEVVTPLATQQYQGIL